MAERYWVEGSGKWNETTHWSSYSGGPSGSSVPTASDDVYFDDNSFPNNKSSTIDVNRDVVCNVLVIQRHQPGYKNVFDFSGRNISIGTSIAFNKEHFILSGATITVGTNHGSSLNSHISFYSDENTSYETENLTLNMIKKSSSRDTCIYIEHDALIIPNIFVNYTYETTPNDLEINIENKNCHVYIENISNNFKNNLRSYVYFNMKEGCSFNFDNFNLTGSLEKNFELYLSTIGMYKGYEEFAYLVKTTSDDVVIEKVDVSELRVSDNVKWIIQYGSQIEDRQQWWADTGPWTFYSPLYWIGGSGELQDPENWSLTSGGPPSHYYPFPINSWYGNDEGVIYFDLIFDENSFNSNNSNITFTMNDEYYDMLEYMCRSIDSRNCTKTFTIEFSADEDFYTPYVHDISVLNLYLSNKITFKGKIVDPNDMNKNYFLDVNIKYDFLQNGATLGPQFILSVGQRYYPYANVKILSDVKIEKNGGIYIFWSSGESTDKEEEQGKFNSNGYNITSPFIIFDTTAGVS